MKKQLSLTIVVIYLLSILASLAYFAFFLAVYPLGRLQTWQLPLTTMLIGGVGGILYCLRGVYLNYCVKGNWSNEWIPWYLIRPVTSILCGGVSYLFLKAGLLILEAQKDTDASNLGFYAFAFIAGLNVDNFIKKVEDIAETTWGIAKSRSSKND